jgi:hypothetical protein
MHLLHSVCARSLLYVGVRDLLCARSLLHVSVRSYEVLRSSVKSLLFVDGVRGMDIHQYKLPSQEGKKFVSKTL